MLYLYGESGTIYYYIHLNNDLTMGNDNRGKCVNGVAYAVRNGARVAPGQQIAYVGDSGDADGLHAHLHFEVHPGGGKAVSPYPYLQKAYTLTGTVASATLNKLVVNVTTSQAWPSGLTLTKLNRAITLAVPDTALVQTITPGIRTIENVSVATKGQKVVVWTQPAPASLKAQRGDDGVLSAALIQLG